MSSRQQQKEQARAARIAAEERQRAAERRRQRLSMLLGAGLLAVVGVVVAIVISQSGSKSAAAPSPAKTADLFQGVPEHGNTLGYPQAKVVLEEFGDLKCPVCRAYALQSLPTVVTRYVATGKVRLVFHNLLVIDPGPGGESERAARMALAAGRQNRLWPFIDQFYAQQQDETTSYVTDGFLRHIGRSVRGLDVPRALAARNTPAVNRQLAQDQQLSSRYGFHSTPSFLLYRAGSPPQPYDQSFDPQTLGTAIDGLLARR